VVLCGTIGYESVCAHRSVRHFAERAAALGFPAMRFHYDGIGDSAGTEHDPGRWEAWQQSVLEAVRELRLVTGVPSVCLSGIRLGALIANAAARRSSDVVGLALLAGSPSGRAWLREMRAWRATQNLAEAPRDLAPPPGVDTELAFDLPVDARDNLVAETLEVGAQAKVPKVLIIDRADRPPLGSLVERLRTSGASVEHAVLPGFVEMLLDPHESIVPAGVVETWARWLDRTFPAAAADGQPPALAGPASGPAVVSPGVEEQAHRFGDGARLFGITSASFGVRPQKALLLLNSGGIHRIGLGSLYVKLARRLAARGWLVLRYDASGIGDSLSHPGAEENVVYSPHAVADLRAAIDFLRARYDLRRIEAIGLCSGAYHAFKGAVSGLPLTGIVVANPLVFFWKEGMSLKYPAHEVVQAAAEYRRSVFQPAKWLKLLREQRDLVPMVAVVGRRLLDAGRAIAHDAARILRISLADDLAAEVDAVVRRGVALRFVFSEGDPGEALLRAGVGSRLRRLERKGVLRVDHLPGCDHSLSLSWMHEALWRLLVRSLDGP